MKDFFKILFFFCIYIGKIKDLTLALLPGKLRASSGPKLQHVITDQRTKMHPMLCHDETVGCFFFKRRKMGRSAWSKHQSVHTPNSNTSEYCVVQCWGVFTWWKSLGLGSVTCFVVIWQLMSNHGLINTSLDSSRRNQLDCVISYFFPTASNTPCMCSKTWCDGYCTKMFGN